MYCEADTFLNELHKLFERKKKGGTVWVTMKRSNQRPSPSPGGGGSSSGKKKKKQPKGAAAAAAAPLPPPPDASEYKCLLRATDGKRKISTSLGPAEYAKFQASYALILRAHMDSLKKREKSKAKREGGGGGK